MALGFPTQVILVHSLLEWGWWVSYYSDDLGSTSHLLQSPSDLHSECSQDQRVSGLKEGMRLVSPSSTEVDRNPCALLIRNNFNRPLPLTNIFL